MTMITAKHDVFQNPLVRDAKYVYTQVSNGVHKTIHCIWDGSYTATGMARVKVVKEDTYCGGSLMEQKEMPEPVRPVRNVHPYILVPA